MFVVNVLPLALAWASVGLAASTAASRPIVDLGYERHQAIKFNDSASYYKFQNIRYAAPPVGKLRFAEPHAPAQNRGKVQDGSVDRICGQATPFWQLIARPFVTDYIIGQTFDPDSINDLNNSKPAQDPRVNEDCLFLDVFVPKKIFKDACNGRERSKLKPVLVWIHGGGYANGAKNVNPSGLLDRSGDGILFVGINYRLGALGFMAGPTFEQDGTANAGLYDQRFALEWVQKNIHLFGGDKDKVTILGESAGGGSVVHQITAFGGLKGKVPFRAAIAQSPAWLPLVSADRQEENFKNFTKILGVSTVAELRQLPSEKVIAASEFQIRTQSHYGSFVFGPSVDGKFAPALPGQLLLHGQYDRSLAILTGHNANEGLVFVPYYLGNESLVRPDLRYNFPGISDSVLDYIETIYPAIYDGSYGYKDWESRAALLISEFALNCNANYLARAYNNHTYAYQFSIFPPLHGFDVPYTFNVDNPPTTGVLNVTIAHIMQDFITSFTINKRPSSKAWGRSMPQYGSDGNIVDLNQPNITVTRDPAANPRCYWWQKGLYY